MTDPKDTRESPILTPQQSLAQKKLIVALDFPSATPALELAMRLEGTCSWFKVGLELYLAAGNSVVESLRRSGHSVFLDLKLHDIPNTVAGAVRSAAATGASLLTVHALGGPAMIEAAAAELARLDTPPKLLAVTLLTSMDAQQMRSVGLTNPSEAQVLQLAQMARTAGADGVVASPLETAALRKALGKEPLLVIPGIRSADAPSDDQKRTATPAAAIANGASMLVVGRPITQAADPVAAARAILDEIALSQSF
jgi:orotidine-5'-phosphate decarboxylase